MKFSSSLANKAANVEVRQGAGRHRCAVPRLTGGQEQMCFAVSCHVLTLYCTYHASSRRPVRRKLCFHYSFWQNKNDISKLLTRYNCYIQVFPFNSVNEAHKPLVWWNIVLRDEIVAKLQPAKFRKITFAFLLFRLFTVKAACYICFCLWSLFKKNILCFLLRQGSSFEVNWSLDPVRYDQWSHICHIPLYRYIQRTTIWERKNFIRIFEGVFFVVV